MKTPEEWLKENYGILLGDNANPSSQLDLIRRIQSDAQPKFTTGEEAKRWPVNTPILAQCNNGEIYAFKKSGAEGFGSGVMNNPGYRFARLDDILAKPWPKDSDPKSLQKQI
jgi:hypothetical protein